MSESEDKKLTDLRVVDLKAELEKRGCDKNGVKQVLMQRLKEALEAEGLDPETYVFESKDSKKRSSLQIDDKPEDNLREEQKKPESPALNIEAEKSPKVEDVENLQTNTTDSKPDEKKVTCEPALEENLEPKPDAKEVVKDESKPASLEEDDDPIHLTLDEETLHDVESETADKFRDDASTDDKKKKEVGDSKEESRSEKQQNGDGYRRSSEKLHKKISVKSNPNVVWVSNVAQNTRASELKAALSACGKVTGAKVVVNARYPGSNCFGYVTMGSLEDVANVIAKLNNTELKGHMIKIEKFDEVRADQIKVAKNASEKTGFKSRRDEKSTADGKDTKKEGERDDKKREGNASEKDLGRTKSKERMNSSERRMSRDDRFRSNRSRSSGTHGGVLTFAQIKEERDRQKLREKERILREESRRRHEEHARQKEIERRQRQEAMRLEKEKEKLRIEKEKIAREKAELVRLQRERQRLEREKITREKLELERTLLRLEEDRRGKRPATFRSDERFNDRKRPLTAGHFEAPPAPRFDTSNKNHDTSNKSKPFGPPKGDYGGKSRHPGNTYSDKRGRDYDGPSGSSSSGNKFDNRPYNNREPRNRDGPPRGGKDRYNDRERDRSPHGYRGGAGRDKPDASGPSRYDNSNEMRFDGRGSGNNWSAAPKSFAAPKPWEKSDWRSAPPTGDRWISNNPSQNRTFSNDSVLDMDPLCPPPPGINNYNDSRFQYGKSMSPGMRKY